MKKILVLDDEKDVEFIFTAMLADEIDAKKIEIDFYFDPRLCLNLFQSPDMSPYDYIFSDINMPFMSGIEFTRELRRTGYKGQIAYISAYLADDYKEIMKEMNINPFISKPIDFNLIKDLLKI